MNENNFSESNSLNVSDVAKAFQNIFGMQGSIIAYVLLTFTGSKRDYIILAFCLVGIVYDLLKRYIRGSSPTSPTNDETPSA